MNQNILRLIRSGATAELADAVHSDPALVSWRDSQGVSALMWSIYAGQTMARDFLLAELSRQAILLDVFEASATGNLARLSELLDSEPSVSHARSGDGWTPLHLAAAFGNPACVAALLRGGADVTAISFNAQANQPLHAALALGCDSATVRLLLDHGADPNATQAGGFTPLFSAAAANRRDLAELLLGRGADAQHRCDVGKRAADFARDRGHSELAEWLEAQPG
jgi:ankyrin repeat protein